MKTEQSLELFKIISTYGSRKKLQHDFSVFRSSWSTSSCTASFIELQSVNTFASKVVIDFAQTGFLVLLELESLTTNCILTFCTLGIVFNQFCGWFHETKTWFMISHCQNLWGQNSSQKSGLKVSPHCHVCCVSQWAHFIFHAQRSTVTTSVCFTIFFKTYKV